LLASFSLSVPNIGFIKDYKVSFLADWLQALSSGEGVFLLATFYVLKMTSGDELNIGCRTLSGVL